MWLCQLSQQTEDVRPGDFARGSILNLADTENVAQDDGQWEVQIQIVVEFERRQNVVETLRQNMYHIYRDGSTCIEMNEIHCIIIELWNQQ